MAHTARGRCATAHGPARGMREFQLTSVGEIEGVHKGTRYARPQILIRGAITECHANSCDFSRGRT